MSDGESISVQVERAERGVLGWIDRDITGPMADFQDPDQEWWAAFCAELFRQYEEAQLIAAPVCAVAQYFSYVVPSCAALQGGAMVLLLGYLIECQM